MTTEIRPYKHYAQYYETDQMGIIHHSNYIRWFEESRVDFLEQIGCGYRTMEELGILSPVLTINCEYKSMVRFGDTVLIIPKIEFFNGVKLTISYSVIDEICGEIKAKGESKHCFINKSNKPINLKKFNEDTFNLINIYLDERKNI